MYIYTYIDIQAEEHYAKALQIAPMAEAFRDFNDTVYPFFESDTSFLECVFVVVCLVVW